MAASATQNGFHGVQTSLILSKEEYIVLVWTQLLPMKLVWKLTVKKVTVTEGWEQPCLHPVALSLSFSKSTMSRTFFSINANDNFSADRKSTVFKDHSAIDRRYSQILPWKIYFWYLLHLLQVKPQCLGISTLRTSGKVSRKKLLFFWILSKWGGEGPVQMFFHLFISAFLVIKRSLFPPKS